MSIDIEQALVYKLVNTAGISSLISTRCHPLRLPELATLPALVYSEVSAPTETTMDETSTNALTHARYQIDAWATDYDDAVALAAAVFTALEGFSGVITSGSNTFTIQACMRNDKRANDDPETRLYWISQDFVLWYNGG